MTFQELNSLFTKKQIEKILFYEIRLNLLFKLFPFFTKHLASSDDDASVNYFDSFSKKNEVLYQNKKGNNFSFEELVENSQYSSYQEAMSQKSKEANNFLNMSELMVDFDNTLFIIVQAPDLTILSSQISKRMKEQKDSLLEVSREEHFKQSSEMIKYHKKQIDLFKNNSIKWFLKYLQQSSLKIDATLKKDLLKIFYLSFDIILDDFLTGNYILKNNITLIDDYVFSKYQHDQKLSHNFSKLIEVAKVKRFSDNLKENLLTYYVLIEELNFEIMFLLKDFYNYLIAIKNNNEMAINQYIYIVEEGQLGFYVSGLEKQLKRATLKAEESQTYVAHEHLQTILEKLHK
jgi:hypothetical protein